MPQKLLYEKIADIYRLLRALKLSILFFSYRTVFSIYLLLKITSFQRYQQSNILSKIKIFVEYINEQLIS